MEEKGRKMPLHSTLSRPVMRMSLLMEWNGFFSLVIYYALIHPRALRVEFLQSQEKRGHYHRVEAQETMPFMLCFFCSHPLLSSVREKKANLSNYTKSNDITSNLTWNVHVCLFLDSDSHTVENRL